MKKPTKESRITAELTRLCDLCAGVDANQMAAVVPLLQNAAFMKVTLEDLQQSINAVGTTDTYQNGANQKGVKQSAELQAYNSLIKNYAAVSKTIAQLLPPEKKLTSDRLITFREKTEEELREEEAREEERQRKIRAEIDRAIEYQRKEREKRSAQKAE